MVRLKLDSMAWALLAGLGAIVGLGLLAAMFTRIDLITAVFPWRLAPYLTVAAFMALAISLTPPKTVSPVRRLAAAGLMIAVVFATRMDTRAALWLGAIIGVALASGAIERRTSRSSASALRDGPAIVALLLLGALMFRAGLWRKDMFGMPYKPAAESLFAWCRDSTPPGTVFVIPPDMPAFRLETGRAVVVDWKCMPLTPADQVEWWRRNVRLAGREVRDDGDMVSAFASLDAQRAASLAGEYGARYLIVDRRVHAGDCSTLPRVFRNAWFDVHELPLPDPSRERKGVVNAHADPPTT